MGEEQFQCDTALKLRLLHQPNGRRIAFILPTMQGGGAERLTISLVEGVLERGYEVDLVLTERGGTLMPLVPEQVHVEVLGCKRVRSTVWRLRDYFSRRQPGAAIVSLWPLTVAATLARMGMAGRLRLVVTEHAMLSAQYPTGRAARMLRTTMRWISPKADEIVAVSEGVGDDVARMSGMERSRITTISNPVPRPRTAAFSAADTDLLWQGKPGRRLLSVGTFKPVKNQDLLLRAFAAFIESGEQAILALLGEGDLEADLRKRVRELGIEESVIMPGFVLDPSPWYASADLFALSSDYEGFGNVIVEAMHFGLPVVSTDCPSGPGEILENGRFGRLVPPGDALALANAMRSELADPTLPEVLKARAAQFSVDRAVDRYLELAFPDQSESAET